MRIKANINNFKKLLMREKHSAIFQDLGNRPEYIIANMQGAGCAGSVISKKEPRKYLKELLSLNER